MMYSTAKIVRCNYNAVQAGNASNFSALFCRAGRRDFYCGKAWICMIFLSIEKYAPAQRRERREDNRRGIRYKRIIVFPVRSGKKK